MTNNGPRRRTSEMWLGGVLYGDGWDPECKSAWHSGFFESCRAGFGAGCRKSLPGSVECFVRCGGVPHTILRAKLIGFARCDDENERELLARWCSKADKSGWSFVIGRAISDWLSAFSQSP